MRALPILRPCLCLSLVGAPFAQAPPTVSLEPAAVSAANLQETDPNPMRVALLRWWEANQAPLRFPVGDAPAALAFDGKNVWISHDDIAGVSVVNPSDGAIGRLAQVTIDSRQPGDMAFDGGVMWLASRATGIVARIRASDGKLISSTSVGTTAVGLAFDGADMWIAGSDAVWRFRAGGPIAAQYVDDYPISGAQYLAYDGQDMWITTNAGTVVKLRGTDGVLLGTFPVGTSPAEVAFDGTSVWVVNGGSDDVTRLNAEDGALLGTFPVGTSPHAISFDGENMWVVNSGSNDVTLLSGQDGAQLGTFTVGGSPRDIAFDGVNLWVTNGADGTVSKL